MEIPDDCGNNTTNSMEMASSNEVYACNEDTVSSEQDVDFDEQLFSGEIAQLRDFLPLSKDIDVQGCNDSFLLTFLQARRFNVDCAFDLLCTYFRSRKKHPSLFKDLKASELRYILEDGFPCVLPYLDADGSKVMVLFAGIWDIETFDVEIILKAMILSFQHLSKEREVRQKGIVLIVDFSGWIANHAKKLNFADMTKIVTIFQDCFTLWFKSVHLINQPWYINVLITLTKPFMKDGIQERIFLHGNNMTTLHSHISPENLPAEFGGNRTEVDQCFWANHLLATEKVRLKRASTIRRGNNPLRLSISGTSMEVCESSESEPLLSNECDKKQE